MTLVGTTAGRREWVALATLGLPTLLVAMDFSVLYLAVPHLSADMAPSGTEQLWIVDIYGFLIAGFLVTMGTLGDRIGRKRLLLIGGAVFGLASVAAAYSTSPETLIASRALLGVAGAAVMPSTLALASGLFPDPKRRSRAIAIYLSCFMGGLTLGPVVGGLMLHYFWWGAAFLVAVPGILLLLMLGPSLLPEQRSPVAGRLDPVSVALSLAAILPFVYGLKELARDGWSLLPAAATVFGVAVGLVFVRRQRALVHPLLDLRLFANRTYRSALVVMFVAGVVGTGTYLVITLYLQNVAGVSPLVAGLLLAPPAILMIIGNMVSPAMANHVRPAYLIAGGLFLAGLGYLTFTLTTATSGPTMIFVAFCVAMVGTGPMAALGNHLAMGSAPQDKAGAAASIMQTGNELGLGLGVAVFGTLATAVYRGNVESALGSLPPDVAEAARESIDGAVAAAERLPADAGAELLATARDAFTSGVHAVGAVSAVAFTGLAVLAAVALKHARNVHGEEPAPPPEPDPLDEIDEFERCSETLPWGPYCSTYRRR
ncbi:MFS transporter [Actinophytocola sp.]|uniref:MFS transporter n=1 Tax=Actinophytocola sp. TaxID=1872138 RepID=UPI002ED0D736